MLGGLKPSTNKPQYLSFSPKLMGPSIASIPFFFSHSFAFSKRRKAAVLSLMHSKKPIPPTGSGSFSVFL
jgi:hypothetical protein